MTDHARQPHDIGLIRQALILMCEPGQVVELRALGVSTSNGYRPQTVSGYFNSLETLSEHAARLRSAKGIYITLNPVKPALLARAANHLRRAEPGDATADDVIELRRWVLIDCDPVRPAGISATDAEHAAGLARARIILEALSAEGWPAPLVADSGNGAHLLYRIDLPNDDTSRTLLKRVLEALAFRFDDEVVTIDQSVFNAARISKLYGTMTRKGDHVDDRPHRQSCIIDWPEHFTPVPTALLEALASSTPQPAVAQATGHHSRQASFSIDTWIAEHGLSVNGPQPWAKGRKWIFPVCPWNAEHANHSAYIIEHASGAIAAGCHHNGCHGKGWHDLREMFEPGYSRDRKISRATDAGEEATQAGNRPGLTQAQTLVQIGSQAELFRTAEGQLYARVLVNGHHEVLNIGERGSGFASWLIWEFHALKQAHPSATAVTQALEFLRAKARFDSPLRDVWTRVAWQEDTIYLDLANDAWEAVKITADGWDIVTEPPVYFRRAKGMLPLPHPDRHGTIQDLHTLINAKASNYDLKLIDGWLVHTLMPNGPYAVLAIHGEQGSTKSMLTKILRQSIDPNQSPSRLAPKEEHDLVISANNAHIVALENLSNLQPWLSDALCCLSTGAGFGKRQLYTDAEEAIFAAKRPVILNGITEVAVRGDLRDRCLFVVLLRPDGTQRKQEKDVWKAFTKQHPLILGAILNATSTALKNWATTTIEDLPRMADFAVWVEAASSSLGWQPHEFLATYTKNQADAIETEIEASPMASTIVEFLEAGKPVQAMLMKTLLEDLTAFRSKDGRPLPQKWPASAQAFSAALRRLGPALTAKGVVIELHEKDKDGRKISLSMEPKDETTNSGDELGDELSVVTNSDSDIVTTPGLDCGEKSHLGDEGDELSPQCSAPPFRVACTKKEGEEKIEENREADPPIEKVAETSSPSSPASPAPSTRERNGWIWLTHP
jgi:hypothetical protein